MANEQWILPHEIDLNLLDALCEQGVWPYGYRGLYDAQGKIVLYSEKTLAKIEDMKQRFNNRYIVIRSNL